MRYNIETDIINNLVDILAGVNFTQEVDVKSIGDNIDQQTQNVIICGISSHKKVYPMTEDYEYILDITLRSWIADDQNGDCFQQICNQMHEALKSLRQPSELKAFLNIDNIVGCVYDGQTKQVTEDSNLITLRYLLYASF